jgi:hypothetical protein
VARELLIWDSVGIDRSTLDSLGEVFGLRGRVCSLAADAGLEDVPAMPASDQFAQAAALACCASPPPAIDFLHSRLAPPQKTLAERKVLWAAAGAAALVAVLLFLLIDWQLGRREVRSLTDELARLKTPAGEARAIVDKVSLARGWYDRRPEMLDCLREITLCFPEEGSVWATSLSIRENMQALLTGKCANETAARGVIDRLKSNRKLENVKPLFIRQSGGTSRDVTFSVSLNLRRAE